MSIFREKSCGGGGGPGARFGSWGPADSRVAAGLRGEAGSGAIGY